MNREPPWGRFEPFGRFANRAAFQRTEPQAIRTEPNRTALSRTAFEPNRTASQGGLNLLLNPNSFFCKAKSESGTFPCTGHEQILFLVSPDDIPNVLKYVSEPGKRFKKVQRGFKRFSREVRKGSRGSRGSNRTGLANPNSSCFCLFV